MSKYNNIPVDETTKERVIVLAKKLGFGERGQGAIVRMLVSEKMVKLGLLPADAETLVLVADGVDGDLALLPAVDDVA